MKKLYMQGLLFVAGLGIMCCGLAQEIQGLPEFIKHLNDERISHIIEGINACIRGCLSGGKDTEPTIPYVIKRLVEDQGEFYVEITIARGDWERSVGKYERIHGKEVRRFFKRFTIFFKAIFAYTMGCLPLADIVEKRFKITFWTIAPLLALPVLWVSLDELYESAERSAALHVANVHKNAVSGFELLQVHYNSVTLRSTFPL